MPISPPAKPSAAAVDANRRGLALREEGRIADAIRCFEEGVRLDPGVAELHANLGTLFVETGDFERARAAFDEAIRLDPGNVGAHLAMYELEQIAHNTGKALRHQQAALAIRSLFSEYAPQEQRRLLVLLAPGDWQANVPVDFLIDRRTTTLHKLYLTSAAQAAAAVIPQTDAVFVAIGESDENAERLHLAQHVVDRLGLPVMNRPQNILRTNRVSVAQALRDLDRAIVPQTIRMTRDALENGTGVQYPIVIRPVGSQAGKDLARAGDTRELQEYLAGVQAQAFYVMPFIDFSLEDGYYRKYRIIIVDGEPYAYHLAISPHWIIHYYNAPMAEHAWMRAEEERFLTAFDSVFGADLRQALRRIAQTLELEYVGVDCSIDRTGRLVVFEADPAMIVHAGDDPQMFGYKIPAARRVFAAFERLVDRVRSV